MIRLVSVCPGCRVELPDDGWTAETAYNASAECLRLNGEVVAYRGRTVWAAWSHAHGQIATMTETQLDGWDPSRSIDHRVEPHLPH